MSRHDITLTEHQLYALLSTVVAMALEDAPHLDQLARYSRAQALAVRTVNRLFEEEKP